MAAGPTQKPAKRPEIRVSTALADFPLVDYDQRLFVPPMPAKKSR
jgi:hypothetical protein